MNYSYHLLLSTWPTSSDDPIPVASTQEAVNSSSLAKPQFPNSLLLIFVTPLLTNWHRSKLACIMTPQPTQSATYPPAQPWSQHGQPRANTQGRQKCWVHLHSKCYSNLMALLMIPGTKIIKTASYIYIYKKKFSLMRKLIRDFYRCLGMGLLFILY